MSSSEIPQDAAARVASIDVARGLVMVLMAIDHVRVYAGVPAYSADPAVFFTRWVTHFCAPAFVFLAGTSAFLYGERRRDVSALGWWLVSRGAWLILLELTLVRVAWTFNLQFGRYMLAGVLWMLGWCMILMAALVRLPLGVIATIGLAIVAGHNLTALVPRERLHALVEGDLGWLFKILYFGGGLGGGENPSFLVLYSLVPWIGVMATGYAFGALLRRDPVRRRRACLAIGLGAVAAFLVLRSFNLYGDRPWAGSDEMPGWLAFLNTTKYPASLLFLLMTLGPLIASLPLLEGIRGRLGRWLAVFGRVPFTFYLLHIPLIHALAVLISLFRTPEATAWLFQDHPLRPGPVPAGYVWSLGLLYGVTAVVVVALYFPCRRVAQLKAHGLHPWLRYI